MAQVILPGKYVIRALGSKDWYVRAGAVDEIVGKEVVVHEIMERYGGLHLSERVKGTFNPQYLSGGKICLLAEGLVLEPINQDTPELLAYDLVDQETEVDQEDY